MVGAKGCPGGRPVRRNQAHGNQARSALPNDGLCRRYLAIVAREEPSLSSWLCQKYRRNRAWMSSSWWLEEDEEAIDRLS